MMETDEPVDLVHRPGPVFVMLGKEQDQWLRATLQLKHLVIGSNRQKEGAIESGAVPRLLEWMMEDALPQELRTESAILLGSLAFGTERHIQQLVHDGAVPILLRGLSNPNLHYVEACLRCLRTIFTAANPPVNFIYQDPSIIPHLLSIIHQTLCTKETIASILANSCTCPEHQNILLNLGAIPALAPLLAKGTMYKIQMPILKFFAALCYQNIDACIDVVKASVGEEGVLGMIRKLQSRDKTSEMQMAAAKCLAYVYRGNTEKSPWKREVAHEVLHTLVRMCKKDRTLEENVEGAETLAYLIQQDPELQYTASICDHSIKALSDYLSYTEIQQLDARQAQKKHVNWDNLLKAAAFQAFAAISANDEEIRKKIIGIENLLECVVKGMECSDQKVQVAACRCLHSLSRSVQQIRTNLRDHKAWEQLIKLMESPAEEVLKIASATICNMLLDFSPSKEIMVEHGAVRMLVNLCHKQDNPALRLNGVWGLMNMAFNADQRIKMQIVDLLGSDLLYSLLSEHNHDILMRTLGLMRNLLTKKHHIDNIMAAYGANALQGVSFILGEPSHTTEIREQALCVLANISDGPASKTTVLDHAEVMKQLINILKTSEEEKLQVASIYAVKNLLSGDDEDTVVRMRRLRDFGVQPHLQRLAQSPVPHIQERAKSALRHFT
ncbi:armadillo repeat-containing protein 8-like [Babylonia areolata]|uniref:armadillo repeat-containing protein 8-like n=1 Tax=Babylonia areolata TaxID=304850 RepID=UPI003FD336AC